MSFLGRVDIKEQRFTLPGFFWLWIVNDKVLVGAAQQRDKVQICSIIMSLQREFQFVLLVFLSFILEEVIVIFLIHILKKIKIFLYILKTDKCLCVFTYQFIDFFSILSSLLIIVLIFNCIEIVSKVSLMDADLDDSWLLHNQPIMILESTCWHHGVGFVFIALVAFDVSFNIFFSRVILTHCYLYIQKA